MQGRWTRRRDDGFLAGRPNSYSQIMIETTTEDRVHTIRLRRPEAKNAMNEAMWDAVTEAFIAAADDPGIAVVVFTGSEDSFSAGQDVIEMAQLAMGDASTLERGDHGFTGLNDQLAVFPKPFLCAVNGIGLGFGVTILGYADLAFMSSAARLKCPFTSLGVAPELGSSFLFPQLMGRQNASWLLMSSEWIDAEQALAMGLVFQVCAPDELMETTMRHARTLASRPISSLVETKRVIVESLREPIAEARRQENAAFAKLLGGPDNIEAMTAFAEKRPPNFG